jgi:bacterioferritin-associated ferredoxin
LIICLCLDISEEEIRDFAKRDDLAALYQKGMCQSCGSCREEVKNILEDLIQEDTN